MLTDSGRVATKRINGTRRRKRAGKDNQNLYLGPMDLLNMEASIWNADSMKGRVSGIIIVS